MGDVIEPGKHEDAWLGREQRLSVAQFHRGKRRMLVIGGVTLAIGVIGSIDLANKMKPQ